MANCQYHFSYKVLDDFALLNYGHSEERNGDKTVGNYHVQLPDGRLQNVNYKVDDEISGYVADVQYKNEHLDVVYKNNHKVDLGRHKPLYKLPKLSPAPVHKHLF